MFGAMQDVTIHQNACRNFGKRTMLVVCAWVVLVCASTVQAAAIGEFSSSGRIGYALAAPLLFVDDPDGETKSTYLFQPFTVVYTDKLVSTARFWSEVYYQEGSLTPSPQEIGQAFKRLGARLSIQSHLNLTLPGKPWFGVGLQVEQENYSLRHTVDEEGFLLQNYPDRDNLALSVLVDAATEWRLSRRWDVSGKAVYALPVNKGIAEIAIAAVFLYSF